MLSQFMTQLSRNGVLPMLGWRAYASTMAELSKVRDVYSAKKAKARVNDLTVAWRPSTKLSTKWWKVRRNCRHGIEARSQVQGDFAVCSISYE